MKKLLLLLVLSFSTISAQNKIAITGGSGYFISNTENSLPIVGEKRFKFYFPFALSYQRDNIFGYDLQFEYTFQSTTKDDAILFVKTNPNSPEPVGTIGADVSLTNHSFDFNLVNKLGKYFNYGLGPSFIITHRTFEYRDLLYDRLASSSIGVNGFLEMIVPFSDEKRHYYFTAKFKARYTHSIWFDEGIRKVDDYSQEFLTSQLNVGIGYSF